MLKLLKGIAYITLIVLLFPIPLLYFLARGCLYGFVKRRGPLDFSITHRDVRGRPLLRLGCP